MVSQLRAIRYTMMALVIATGSLFAAPHSSHAVTIMKDFSITVVDDLGTTAGTLSGSFSGDTGADNTLDLGEVMGLTATWTCAQTTPGLCDVTTAPPDFLTPFGLSDLQAFSYTEPSTDTIALALSDGTRAALCGTGSPFTCSVGASFLINGGDVDAFYIIAAVSITDTSTTPIPEPGTCLLLGTGLVGIMGYAFSRRVRPVTTRQAPDVSA